MEITRKRALYLILIVIACSLAWQAAQNPKLLPSSTAIANNSPVNRMTQGTDASLERNDPFYQKDALYWSVLAEFYWEDGYYEEAVLAMGKAVKDSPDVALFQRYIHFAVLSNRFDLALQGSLDLTKASPSTISGFGTTAHLYLIDNKIEKSVPYIIALMYFNAERGSVDNDYIDSFLESVVESDNMPAFTEACEMIQQDNDWQNAGNRCLFRIALITQDVSKQVQLLDSLKKDASIFAKKLLLEYYAAQKDQKLPEYVDAFVKTNDSAELHLLGAELLLQNAHYQNAEKHLKALIQSNHDTDGYARLYLAKLYMMDKKIAQAETILHTLLDSSLHDEVAFLLGMLYEQQGAIEKAVTSYQSISDTNLLYEAEMRIIQYYVHAKQFKKALHHVRLVEPPNMQAYRTLILIEAKLELAQEQFQDAFQTLSLGLRELNDDPELLYMRALIAISLSDFLGARNDLELILKNYPENQAATQALLDLTNLEKKAP